MTKKEFIHAIAEKENISQTKSAEIVQIVLSGITDLMTKPGTQTLCISGFGTFFTKNINSKTGINPKTKKKMIFPAYKKVAFKASTKLKDLVKASS